MRAGRETTQPDVEYSPEERIAAWRAGKELPSKSAPKSTVPDELKEDVLTDLDTDTSPERAELDAILSRIGVVEAYNRWCGKTPVSAAAASKTEGIKVSCPVPGHRDNKPSAWLNTEKGTWYCGACEVGGDCYDIAAYKFGFEVPGYKSKRRFVELREAMASDLGWVRVSSGGVSSYEAPVETTAPETTAPEPEPPSKPALSVVETIYDDEQEVIPGLTDAEPTGLFPALPWRGLLDSRSTLLLPYMDLLSQDDLPEEFHFWNAIMGLSCALGHNTTLRDRKPVFANLYVCLLGSTGSGKSQSQGHVKRLIMDALPLDEVGDPYGEGIKWIKSPASGEALIKAFSRPVPDPGDKTGKRIMGYAPVRGIVDFPELSALMARTQRVGSNLDAALIDLFDRDPTFGSTSITGGTVVSPEPYGCLMTTSQPSAFKRLVGQKDLDNGFLNRFLFIGGIEKPRHPMGGDELDLTPLILALTRVSEWSQDNRLVDYTDDGAQAWRDFFYGTVMPHVKADQSAILGRAVLTCKKLMLLLAADRVTDRVDADIVEQMKVLYEYLLCCYGISTTAMRVTEESEVTDEIVRVMRKHETKYSSDGMSSNDIRRYIDARLRKQSKLIKTTLETMEALGDVEKIERAMRGPGRRPGARYRLVAN